MKKVCVLLRQNQISNNILKFNSLKNVNFKSFSTAETKSAQPQEVRAVDYEKEWTALFELKKKAQLESLNNELSEYEKKEVKALVDRVLALNLEEKNYYIHLVTRKSELMAGADIMSYDSLHPTNMLELENLWPKENPKWFATPNLQSSLGSFSGQAVAGKMKSFIFQSLNSCGRS